MGLSEMRTLEHWTALEIGSVQFPMFQSPMLCHPPTNCGGWLPRLDLNQDAEIQSLVCYRYTTGQ